MFCFVQDRCIEELQPWWERKCHKRERKRVRLVLLVSFAIGPGGIHRLNGSVSEATVIFSFLFSCFELSQPQGQLLPFWLCPQVNQLLGFPRLPLEGFPHGSELEATDSGEWLGPWWMIMTLPNSSALAESAQAPWLSSLASSVACDHNHSAPHHALQFLRLERWPYGV